MAADAGSRLRVIGAAGRFVTADGRVLPPDGASAAAGGELWLTHGRDPLAVWLEAEGQDGPFPEGEVVPAEPVDGPVTLALDGPRRLVIRLDHPALVTARAPGASCCTAPRTAAPCGPASTGSWTCRPPAGTGEIDVRAGRRGAQGALVIGIEAPVDVGEGLGPATLLAPGDTRLFRLTTTREGPVGLGIRADVDRVQARLLDARGAEIAAGASLMPELAPGVWLLALHLPEDAPATRARPAVGPGGPTRHPAARGGPRLPARGHRPRGAPPAGRAVRPQGAPDPSLFDGEA
ncbi:MAG: hypothetical protein R3F43_06815 [bacterium]